MNRKLIAVLAVALVAAAVLAASPVAEKTARATESVVVTDMIGRNVEIVPGSYTRVVCIGAGALRMYTYINGADLLCGVEDIDNTSLQNRPKMFDSVAIPYRIAYETEFSSLPSCGVGGPQAQAAEAEKILSCNPDIVISEYEDVQKEDALQEQLGIPVITLRSGPNNVFDDSFMGSLRLLGLIFGRKDRAEAIVSFIDSERSEISSRTAVVPEDARPSVYVCGLGNWGTTNHLMTMPNFIAFDVANVRNAASGLSSRGVQSIEKEYFAALGKDMDIIVMDAAAVKNIKPLYKEDPTMFDTCKAWRDGEVYLQMAFNAYYTNYEIALANTWFVAKTVYPELFKDIDLSAKMDEITEVFLGKPLAEKIFSYPTSFGGYQKIDTTTFFN